MDACVLIDYVEADATVLRTVSKEVAPIVIARPVLDEVKQLDEESAVEMGLTIVDVELSLVAEAARESRALSFEDQVCLLLAKRERWTCVTNDAALRRECAAERVQTVWGLEMMLRAVAAGAMTAAEATTVAKAMHERNPRFIPAPLLKTFAKKLATIVARK